MKWRYRGRHRASRFSQPVRELIRDCQRISIDEFFAQLNKQWDERR